MKAKVKLNKILSSTLAIIVASSTISVPQNLILASQLADIEIVGDISEETSDVENAENKDEEVSDTENTENESQEVSDTENTENKDQEVPDKQNQINNKEIETYSDVLDGIIIQKDGVITGYNGSSAIIGELTIPREIKGIVVKEIGERAFINQGVTKLTFH